LFVEPPNSFCSSSIVSCSFLKAFSLFDAPFHPTLLGIRAFSFLFPPPSSFLFCDQVPSCPVSLFFLHLSHTLLQLSFSLAS
jgi:hypothetical protein